MKMYKINEISKLSGLTKRTLRYYDEIGLLKPEKQDNGYRVYKDQHVKDLQMIMLYRELEFSLDEIMSILNHHHDKEDLLKRHANQITLKLNRYKKMLVMIDDMIKEERGELIMTDKDRFEALKDNLIEENEKKYGDEIRKIYKEKVEEANQRIKNMSKKQYDNQSKLEKEIIEKLLEAYQTENPSSPEARQACMMHAQWIEGFWGYYSESAHFNLVNMYLQDERFTQYYDQHQSGLTEFLVDAMASYLNIDNS
jgi:DNA-binding transcriptional MerR regulator